MYVHSPAELIVAAIPAAAWIVATIISTRALYRSSDQPNQFSVFARTAFPMMIAAFAITACAGVALLYISK